MKQRKSFFRQSPVPVVGRARSAPLHRGLQGHVILARRFAKVGVEGVIADRQGEVVRTSVLVLLLPDATALDQFAARGTAKDAVCRCHGIAAGDGFNCDVEVEV